MIGRGDFIVSVFALLFSLPGESERFVIFRLFKSILFFCQLNFILLFPFFIKYYHILFIIIVF